MSQSPPEKPRPAFDIAEWRPSRQALLWVLGGFAVGLLLFLMVWSGGRGKQDFYRVGDSPPTSAAREYAPLPAPLTAAEGLGSLPAPPEATDVELEGGRPRLVETAPPPPPPQASIESIEPGASFEARPIAGQTPAPRYPRQALRRGERGNVLVRVEVGPNGVPVSVGVAQSSGSRLLDRAATDAVLRWRFQPAERNGRPTVGTVLIPIEFRPD